jgi:hypothetical protein
MTYSIDKCVKLLGYEYDLPDEIILKIQKMITKDNMKSCIEQYKGKVFRHFETLHRAGFLNLAMTEDGHNRSCNYLRFLLKPPHNSLQFIDRYRGEATRPYDARLNIGGMWVRVNNNYINPHIYKFGLDNICKQDMVEHMKNNGIKFNKSKKKSELFKIFIKNSPIEPFIPTHINIKKIKYD